MKVLSRVQGYYTLSFEILALLFSGKESRIVIVQWQLHTSLRSRNGVILQPSRLLIIVGLFPRFSYDDSC